MSNQGIHKPAESCSIKMSDGKPCGRTVHSQRAMDDPPDNVCLMHSHDYNKDQEAFERELKAIIDGSSIHNRLKSKCDFHGFVFFNPFFSHGGVGGRIEMDFGAATFKWLADFSYSTFNCRIDFRGARFERGVDFERAGFAEKVFFPWASFRGNANFHAAVFSKGVEFSRARFSNDANFASATFSCTASFRQVSFDGDAFFSSRFEQDADFSGATFGDSAEFYGVDFSRIADFRNAAFRKPNEVVFHRVNNIDQMVSVGMRARLVGCLLEDIRFEDVNWNRRNGRIYLEDEADLYRATGGLGAESEGDEQPPPVLTHEIVADAYRRLVNNFEKSRQYAWAEECFLGEMEMRRRNPRHFFFARFDWVRNCYAKFRWARWLGETISLTGFYRWLSNYGSSYVRALCVLAAFLVLFALLLPGFGLRIAADSKPQASCPAAIAGSPEAAVISWHCALANPHWARELAHTFGAGFWNAFEVAVFQRNRTIEPATAGARRAEIFESIVISGQFALLLLAIRRRFRR